MHVIQETRRLSDECSIQNQTEKTFYGVSENEIVHLTSEILMSHNLRWVLELHFNQSAGCYQHRFENPSKFPPGKHKNDFASPNEHTH